jgi:hypothetical protein
MFYIEYLNLDFKYFTRKQQTKEDNVHLRPTFGAFNPGLTFSCLQP